MHLPVGTLLQGGRYEIIRYISSGGFGCTYEARDTKFKSRVKSVAIKEFFVKDFCNRDADSNTVVVATNSKVELVKKLRVKFLEEANALFELEHPNIVRVTDTFEENGTAYYVMEYISGTTLAAIVDKEGSLSEEKALGYIRQVADALKYVHSHNRSHFDVKPQNIMVDSNDRAVLIDFGVSKQYDAVNGVNISTLVGYTPGYAPMELTYNDIAEFSPTTDIYSLGATLFNLVTGTVPPSACRVNEDGLPVPVDVSAQVFDVIKAAMQPRRKDRPQNIDEFLFLVESGKMQDESDGETVLNGNEEVERRNEKERSAGAVISNEGEKSQKNKPRKSIWLILLLLLLIAVAGAWFLFGGTRSSNTPKTDTKKQIVKKDTPTPSKGKEQEQPVVQDNSFKTREFSVKGVSFKMVAVEGGKFRIGAQCKDPEKDNYDKDACDNEHPVHDVTVSDYYIGETEVTQALWEAVMDETQRAKAGDNESRGIDYDCPMYYISYDDCAAFVKKLNEKMKAEGKLPAGREFRLPTEAEWEFAARGGNRSKGYQYSGSNTLSSVAWYWDNGNETTHPVKEKHANELGLYDMSGNVEEWCYDSYSDYPTLPQTNPKVDNGPGSARVLRGGSWHYHAQDCRVAHRSGVSPSGRSGFIGLRLAL